MKFVPKKVDHSMNVSQEHPAISFLKLITGLFCILFGIYFFSGLAVDWVVTRISPGQELILAKYFMDHYDDGQEPSIEERQLQDIVNQLARNLPVEWNDFKVHISDSEDVNALALPGGHVVVFRGLLESVDSENELAMVLGHELGHFLNRDHLRGMGRGLVLYFFCSLVLGDQGGLQSIVNLEMNQLQSGFSKSQESAADLEGLKLLNKHYGHVGGATDFFDKLSRQENRLFYALFNQTHPLSINRVAQLNDWISENDYLVRETVPYIKVGQGNAPPADSEIKSQPLGYSEET